MANSNKRKDSKGRVLRKGEIQKQDNLYMYRWTDNNHKRQCCYASTLDKLREKEKEIDKSLTFMIEWYSYFVQLKKHEFHLTLIKYEI